MFDPPTLGVEEYRTVTVMLSCSSAPLHPPSQRLLINVEWVDGCQLTCVNHEGRKDYW